MSRVTLLLQAPSSKTSRSMKPTSRASHCPPISPSSHGSLCHRHRGVRESPGGGTSWGISLDEVDCMVHVALKLGRLHRQVVDVLIGHLAKYFDIIA